MPLIPLAIVPGLTYIFIFIAYRRLLLTKRDAIAALAAIPELKSKYKASRWRATPEGVFLRHFSLVAYAVPVALNVLTTFLFVAAFLYGKDKGAALPQPASVVLGSIGATSLAGFAGSYLWSHYEMLRRYSVLDLSPTALYILWLRLVAGALAGPALSAALAETLRVSFAFAIGAFPLAWFQTTLREVAIKRLETTSETVPSEPATLHSLQGMTEPLLERLAEENITSTQHLALADPVRIFLKTNLELTVILDLIDQAELHLYVQEHLSALRAAGLRSAIEVAEIRDYLDSDDVKERARGDALLELAAKALGAEAAAVRKIVDTLYEDPQLNFVWQLWEEGFGNQGSGENTTVARPTIEAA